MAYNNGFPIGYQQMYYPQQAPAQTQQINNGIIWVQGENAAKSFPVGPNTSVPLWDSEADVIYIKSADMSGMPSIKVLDYTIRDNGVRTQNFASQTDFATKDDIANLEKEIADIKNKFNDVVTTKEGTNA